MSQSQENLRTDGRKEGETLSYRSIPGEAGNLTTSLQQVTGRNRPNLVFKKNANIFSNKSTTQKDTTVLRLK